MELAVKGGTKSQRKLVRFLVEPILNQLVGSRQTNYLSIEVAIIKNLGKDQPYSGSVNWEDDNLRPRQFIIELDQKMKFRKMCITLTHELIHVKQFVKGELFDFARNHFSMSRWKTKIIDAEVVAYRSLPWEKEAFSKQAVVLRKWRKSADSNVLDEYNALRNAYSIKE